MPILEQDNTEFAIWLGKGHLVSKYRGRCPVSLLTTHRSDAFSLLPCADHTKWPRSVDAGVVSPD